MNDVLKMVGISLIVSVIVVVLMSSAGSSKQGFGAIGAGISNLGGLSLTSNLYLTSPTGCIQEYATSTATSLTVKLVASSTAPTNGSGVIPVVAFGTCP